MCIRDRNDLERASEIARSMVMDYGMSRLGRVTYRESPRSPFLAGGAGDLGATRSHSEQTAREIDQEVRRIIDDSMRSVRQIIESRRAALEAVTRRLIECEVMDGDELKVVVDAATAVPQLVPGTGTERRPVRPAAAAETETADPAAEG